MLYLKKLLFVVLISFSVHSKEAEFVPGELLVKFKSVSSNSSIDKYIKKKGHDWDKSIKLNRGFKKIQINQLLDVKKVLVDYANDPEVEYAQPNYLYHASNLPNDPFVNQIWAIKNTGQTIVQPVGGRDAPIGDANPPASFNGKDLSFEPAWSIQSDCSSVIVAVIDSGINYNHEELINNMWDGGLAYPNHGFDFVDNEKDPMDEHGHGTHVAGIIGASGNNGVGGVGGCWKSKIMALRALNSMGTGTTAQIIQSIDFAVRHKAKIINMSLGGSSGFDYAYSDAISNAKSSNVLVVVAAGNESNDNESSPVYPCNFTLDNLLCVASLNQDFSLANYSNYGINSVDVAAPGTNILSLWPGTNSEITDSLSSGWSFKSTTGDLFGYTSIFSKNAIESNPSNSSYNNNTLDYTWKSFDLKSIDIAILNFSLIYDLESFRDFFSVLVSPINQDPEISGNLIGQITGSNISMISPPDYIGASNYFDITKEVKISKTLNSNTAIGFKLATDSSGGGEGILFHSLSIDALTFNNTTYNVISGTSMATPYVSAIAALVWSYNPNYRYEDVINSIKEGGVAETSLIGKSVTGKVVNALGALNYISTPTDVVLKIK